MFVHLIGCISIKDLRFSIVSSCNAVGGVAPMGGSVLLRGMLAHWWDNKFVSGLPAKG